MNVSFSTLSLNSYYLWLDNYLLQKGQAYINNTSRFYYNDDQVLGNNFVSYSSPFKSFVWDSGVSGANIINSISGDFGTLSRGQSGLNIDFVNGRVILPSSFGRAKIVSGSYSFKDFNLYYANDSQERIIFTNKYYLNSRFGPTPASSGIPNPYDMVTPCIFLSNTDMHNDDWALGGVYNTRFKMTLNILAENNIQLEGAMSLINDSKDSVFPLLPIGAWPLNFYGDYKSGYNYQNIISQYGTPSNLFMISDVQCTKISDSTKIDQSIFVGIADITIEKVRTIR